MNTYMNMLSGALCCAAVSGPSAIRAESPLQERLPNVIIIFTDDLGYGDLGIYGHPTIKTPHLDKMATEGQKWTSFYTAASVCTPSRAGLLTGRLPIRSGMCSDNRRVLFPDSKGGLPESEITIARALKGKGYQTAAIGKWHLGHLPQYLPVSHGFDSYFGIPYSNDMDKTEPTNHFTLTQNETYQAYNVPLMRNFDIVERPADQRTITRRYTEEAVSKIRQFGKDPFFIYLAHNLPHIPLFRSGEFKDKSVAGIYGDVVEEIDWSVGEILKTLKETGVAGNTLVVFTSDNGPWLNYGNHAGSAGGLREGKNTTWEGGQRVPCIMYWPGVIPEGTICNRMASTIDILPTLTNLTDAPLPARKIDGVSILTLLKGEDTANPREIFLYYFRDDCLQAVRKNQWKLVFSHESSSYGVFPPGRDGKFGQIGSARVEMGLFDMWRDPGERYNMKDSFPEVVAELEKIAEEAREDLGDGLTHRKGKNLRPPGRVTDEKNNRPPGCKSE